MTGEAFAGCMIHDYKTYLDFTQYKQSGSQDGDTLVSKIFYYGKNSAVYPGQQYDCSGRNGTPTANGGDYSNGVVTWNHKNGDPENKILVNISEGQKLDTDLHESTQNCDESTTAWRHTTPNGCFLKWVGSRAQRIIDAGNYCDTYTTYDNWNACSGQTFYFVITGDLEFDALIYDHSDPDAKPVTYTISGFTVGFGGRVFITYTWYRGAPSCTPVKDGKGSIQCKATSKQGNVIYATFTPVSNDTLKLTHLGNSPLQAK